MWETPFSKLMDVCFIILMSRRIFFFLLLFFAHQLNAGLEAGPGAGSWNGCRILLSQLQPSDLQEVIPLLHPN